MDINFFEEFPTKRNLDKVKLIKFSSLLFVASKNIEDFYKYGKYIKRLNKKVKVGYWPVLSKEAGYWVSPFSDRKMLENVINELDKEKRKLTVLWDSEFPINRKRFILSIKKFSTNKSMIAEFLQNTKHQIYIAQSPIATVFRRFFRFCGLDFPFIRRKIYMTYTSMVKKPVKEFYGNVIKTNPIVGLGTIAKGIHGNEPILTPEELDSVLKLAKESTPKEVFIFRLGGLNKQYIKVIEKYIN